MSLLLASLVVLTLALVATVIFGLKDGPAEKEAKIKVNKVKLADAPGQYDGEFEKLSAKLKKAKEDGERLSEESALAKKNEAALEVELQKLKSWLEKEKGQDEANKKEMNELKEKLLKKDEEYEKEFSLNLNLKKELDEYREKAENLKAQNNDYAASLRLKEAQIKAYQVEVRNLTQLAAELKKKDEDSQWVSKKEHDELKSRLKELENGKEKL